MFNINKVLCEGGSGRESNQSGYAKDSRNCPSLLGRFLAFLREGQARDKLLEDTHRSEVGGTRVTLRAPAVYMTK